MIHHTARVRKAVRRGSKQLRCASLDELDGTWSALRAACFGDWPVKDHLGRQ